MSSALNQSRPPAALPATLAATLAAILITGCASPAPPRPPSLNLPAPVRDLTAQRIGDQAILHWTTPEKTTDRLPVKGAMTAEICRLTAPPPTEPAATGPAASSPAATCASTRKLPVTPGPTTITEPLPPNLTAEPETAPLIAFQVRILNPSGRSAPSPPQILVPAGAAPPPLEDLHATSSREGIELSWTKSPTPAIVELERLPLNPDGTLLTSAPKPKATSPNPVNHQHATSIPPAPTTPQTTRLHTPNQHDPGGLVDQTTTRNQAYRYTARRIRTLTLEGKTYQLESLSSSPVTITFQDTFPPHIPTGLVAVSNPTAQTPSIDLSWTPLPDLDLAGYLVFRQQLGAPWTKLTPTPIPAPGYSDTTAAPGQRYAYHVTAVDNTGNQSPPSQDVQETLSKP